MMENSPTRRCFITSLTAVGVSSIAGCSSGGGNTTTESPTPTRSPTPTATRTPTTPNQQALDHYDRAVELLVENKDQLDTWATEGFDDDTQTLKALREDLETARSELNDAEQDADAAGDLVVQIDHIRRVTVFQELNIIYYQAVQTFWQLVSDARTFGNNELHDRAAEKWAQARQFLSDIRGVLDDLETAHGDIDNDALNEPDLDYSDDPLDYIDLEDRQAVDAGEDYTTAYEQANLALVQLEKGNTHYENQAYAEARTDWETGRSHLENALSSFEKVVDNEHSPQNIHDDSIKQIGTVEPLIEAFDKFVAGAKAAATGDVESGNQLVGEGYEILGQA